MSHTLYGTLNKLSLERGLGKDLSSVVCRLGNAQVVVGTKSVLEKIRLVNKKNQYWALLNLEQVGTYITEN